MIGSPLDNLKVADSLLLERTYFRNISPNLKIGIFCDITPYRISLIQANFLFSVGTISTWITQPPVQNKTFCVNFVKNQNGYSTSQINHETFQNIDLVLGSRQMMIRWIFQFSGLD